MQSTLTGILMVKSQPDRNHSISVLTCERRLEERASIEFPIEVCGFDRQGRFHTERTTTRNVADSSCNFHLRMEVELGMVLAIRVISSPNGEEADSRPVLFHIVRLEVRPGEYSVGAVKPGPKVPWKVKAP